MSAFIRNQLDVNQVLQNFKIIAFRRSKMSYESKINKTCFECDFNMTVLD